MRALTSATLFLLAATACNPAARADDLEEALVDAVVVGDTNLVSDAIRRGADVHAIVGNGLTPLAVAAYLDEADVAQILLEAGAQPSTPDRAGSPLAIAVALGNVEVVGPLLSKGVAPVAFNDALSVAATKSDSHTLQALLKTALLPEAEMSRLAATLKARFGIADAEKLGPAAVLATLKICRDAGLYTSIRCVSPELVGSLPPIRESVAPQDCDRLAAIVHDGDVPLAIQPVDFNKIDVGKAVPACLDAVERYPKARRFLTELGRAATAAKSPAAADYLAKAATMGSGAGTYLLAGTYEDKSPPDYKTAGTLYAKAASEGYIEAINALGTMYWSGQGVTHDVTKALRLVGMAADRGCGEAMQNLGDWYLAGLHVDKDPAKAFSWYRKSIDVGWRDSEAALGTMYMTGNGIAKDSAEGARLLKDGAAKGDPQAADALGHVYLGPASGTPDDAEARRWFETAAALGSDDGDYQLGALYANGRGVPKDLKVAEVWYKKSADLGNTGAMNALGVMYMLGSMGKVDCQAARFYLERAVAAGDGMGMNDLGSLKVSGQCGKPDYQAGGLLLKKAAALGIKPAESTLALLRKSGLVRP